MALMAGRTGRRVQRRASDAQPERGRETVDGRVSALREAIGKLRVQVAIAERTGPLKPSELRALIRLLSDLDRLLDA
jgi:hypothetical protein